MADTLNGTDSRELCLIQYGPELTTKFYDVVPKKRYLKSDIKCELLNSTVFE